MGRGERRACPRCGAGLRVSPKGEEYCPVLSCRWPKPQSREQIAKRSRGSGWVGAILGFCVGCFVMIVEIVIGAILTATGIGAILGIPILLLSPLSPFIGLWYGSKSFTGECPYCRGSVFIFGGSQSVTCPHCGQQIIVQGQDLYRIE